MTNRYKQHSTMLEIRGLSRGSLTDNSRLDNSHPSVHLELPISRKGPLFNSPLITSESASDDGSTITNGSKIEHSRHKGIQSEDSMTMSESSHYWSGVNSFTTGNTTERSSVYSWGDDEFDYQASRVVQQMFHAIEKMLFESVLSGSSLLQHECREWMQAFPHLRILGKQSVPARDEGFQSVSSIDGDSYTPSPVDYIPDDWSLEVSGARLKPSPVPLHYLIHSESSSGVASSGASSEFSYLHEEIFEEDGNVEEYLAYDMRGVDDEETAKRYHIPRRRRLGYPPITPNACVHDAVLNHLFDMTWSKLVGCLGNHRSSNTPGTKRIMKSLWKVLFDSYSLLVKKQHNEPSGAAKDLYLYQNRDEQKGYEFLSERHAPAGSNGFVLPHSNSFGHPYLVHSRLLNLDAPPSRGSYMDPGQSGSRQFFSPARLSTAPYSSDFTSLNDVMKISQKKLQLRTEKLALPQAVQSEESMGSFGHNLDSGNLYGGILDSSGVGGPSSPHGRSFISLYGTMNRQPSAKNKARAGRPARLLPLALDSRAKTPTLGFDGTLKATKLRISSSGPSNFYGPSEVVGVRVSSPTQKAPPPTAPAITSGSLWLSSRLPPISLDPLNENSLMEFKKPRGRTATSRISSALVDDSLLRQNARGWDNLSRPNTTQAFRTDIPSIKRASSVTPNFSVGNFGGPLLLPKSNSPSGAPLTMGSLAEHNSLFYPQNMSYSPENQSSGLAGITGIGMLGSTNANVNHSPNDQDEETRPVQNSWGYPTRRKRTVIGT